MTARIAVPPTANVLGYAGLLPQLAAVIVVVHGDPAYVYSALALSHAYATLIFSFLGGAWWGLALRSSQPRAWMWLCAILPALLGTLAYVPWLIGSPWPGPSLLWLGIAILASPLVDRRFDVQDACPAGWMRLRWHLSIGLGVATSLIGWLALPA